MGYGLSQVWVMDIGISYPPSWWIQNAMGYHRLWVITVWVISGLTVMTPQQILTTFLMMQIFFLTSRKQLLSAFKKLYSNSILLSPLFQQDFLITY